jgi:hypothetical protein
MTTTTTSHQSSDAADRAVARLARTNPMAAAELEFELAAIDTAYEMPMAFGDGESFTVFTKRGGEQSFTSALTDAQCEQCLRYTSGRSAFAYDMRQAHLSGRISPKQRAWLHKLANDWLVKMAR